MWVTGWESKSRTKVGAVGRSHFESFVKSSVGKNLENANLNLIKKFEFFWGLASKNLNLFSINNPQRFSLILKNSVLIPASKFEVFEGCHKWVFFENFSKNLKKYGLFCYIFYKISYILWGFSRNPRKSSKLLTSASTQNWRFFEVLL